MSVPARRSARFLLGLLPAPALAAPIEVSVPLGRFAREGAVTPVDVRVRADKPLRGVVEISLDGGAAIRQDISMPVPGARRFSIPLPIESWGREVTVAWDLSTGPGNHRVGVDRGPADALHVLVLGEEPLGFTALRDAGWGVAPGHDAAVDSSASPRELRVETMLPAELPPYWQGLSSVDLIAWSSPDPAAMSPEQQDALANWVAAGGMLFVGLSASHANWTGSRLANLAPLSAAGPVPLPARDRLVGAAEIVELPEGLPEVALTERAGSRCAWDGRRSCRLVEAQHGGGFVAVSAFDPAAAEWKAAGSRASYWRAAFGLYEHPEERALPWLGAARQRPADCVVAAVGAQASDDYGAPDAVFRQQVFSALGALQRALPLSAGFVLGFGFVYLLAVGPLEWFVLRQLKRPHWTWLTFPATATVFAIGAGIAVARAKTGDDELRCVTLLDVAGGGARGSAWCSLWSDERQDIRIAPPAPGFARAAQPNLWGAPDTGIDEARPAWDGESIGSALRTAKWSLTSFRLRWAEPWEGVLTVRGGDRERVHNGTGVTLHDAVLVGFGAVRALGDLEPGGYPSAPRDGEGGAPTLASVLGPARIRGLPASLLEDPWEEHAPHMHTAGSAYVIARVDREPLRLDAGSATPTTDHFVRIAVQESP